jgi:glycosyltransferase involved in cell wall biosynthesis
MKNSIKISSIIIAKNEERNIRRCIESQLECIDEIIVLVDDKSGDKTLDIVQSFPKVHTVIAEWKGYTKTKEHALSLTNNDWILWIDADEAVTKELSKELILFKNSSPDFPAYSVPRKSFFLGKWIKHSGWYPGRVIRLFKKDEVRFSDKEVHEDLIVNGATGKLKNNVEHFTDPSIFHYFEKFNRYTTLAAEELKKKNRKAGLNDILLRPFFIFIKMYFIKRGFLDGIHGFILATFSSLYVFTKYCKLWELDNKKDNHAAR